MTTAKIFANGKSQAVRLPKECRFDEKETEVMVRKIGEVVYLYPASAAQSIFIRALDEFPEDFMAEGRDQGVEQEREEF